jgi:biotin carboxyl carrier protein
MEQDFSYNGKVIPVNVERLSSESGDNYRATIEGIVFDLGISRISANELVLFIDGSIRRVFACSTEDKVFIHIDGHILSFDKVNADLKSFSNESHDFGSKDQVSTPMPGKVVKILVKEGERVSIKQPLVIVESMKMENEIKSPCNGIIKSIHFAPGELVATDQPIIKIEPES